jgi:hypothetical protein
LLEVSAEEVTEDMMTKLNVRRNIALELATLAAKVDLHRDPGTASEATWDRLRNRLGVPAASGPRQALLFCGMPVVVDEAVPEGEVWIGSKRFVMPEGE